MGLGFGEAYSITGFGVLRAIVRLARWHRSRQNARSGSDKRQGGEEGPHVGFRFVDCFGGRLMLDMIECAM